MRLRMSGEEMPAGGVASLAAAALLILHACLAWVLRAPGLTTGQDDAVYLQLGRALRHFSYVDLWLAGTPTESLYPPGYPALLAAVVAGFGDRITAAIACNILLSVAALGLGYLLLRRWSPGLALLTLAACAVNPSLVGAAGQVQSEPLFMCCTMLSLWWLTATAATPRTRFAAAALAIAAALTRSIGIALILAVPVQWLLERRFHAAAWFTLASALTFGSWMTWTALAPRQLAGQSYLTDAVYAPAVPSAPRAAAPAGVDSAPHPPAQVPAAIPSEGGGQPPGLIATIAHRLGRNLPTYLVRRIPAGLAMPTVPGTTLDNWFWVLIVAGCGTVGMWLLLQSMPGVAAYLILYMGVLVVWPFLLSRFLVPVIPLLLGVLLAGGRWWGGRLSGTAGRGVAIGLSGILALSALQLDRAEWRAHRSCDRAAPYESAGCYPAEQRSFFQAALALERLTPEGSVLLTPKAATVFSLTGRTAVNELEAASLDAPGLQAFLRRFGVSYILLSHVHRDQWVIAGKLLPFCESLERVEAYGEDALLLRIANSGVPEPGACEAVRHFASAPW